MKKLIFGLMALGMTSFAFAGAPVIKKEVQKEVKKKEQKLKITCKFTGRVVNSKGQVIHEYTSYMISQTKTSCAEFFADERQHLSDIASVY